MLLANVNKILRQNLLFSLGIDAVQVELHVFRMLIRNLRQSFKMPVLEHFVSNGRKEDNTEKAKIIEVEHFYGPISTSINKSVVFAIPVAY